LDGFVGRNSQRNQAKGSGQENRIRDAAYDGRTVEVDKAVVIRKVIEGDNQEEVDLKKRQRAKVLIEGLVLEIRHPVHTETKDGF
jgi:hypothetical protein